jgi:CheY-like chemotaxis protein
MDRNPNQNPAGRRDTSPVILSVDDDDNDAFLLQSAFRSTGFTARVHFAMDGEEALDHLKGTDSMQPPDLVLLDLKMPRLDGFDVLQWIRSQEDLRTVPVAVFTSSEHCEDIRKAYADGANLYVVKPSTYEELVGFLRNLQQSFEDGEANLAVLRNSPAFRPDPES